MMLVSPPLPFMPQFVPPGNVGAFYSFTFKVAGGTPPYRLQSVAFVAVASGPDAHDRRRAVGLSAKRGQLRGPASHLRTPTATSSTCRTASRSS
jgi:hypothetical protein